MKITAKTTNYVIGVAVLSFLVRMFTCLILIKAVAVSPKLNYIIVEVSICLTIFLLYYLSSILKYVNEKRRKIIVLRIYTLSIALVFIFAKTILKIDHITGILPYAVGIVFISLFFLIYLLIQIFTIKNKSLKISFKVWVIGWMLCEVIKLPIDFMALYQHKVFPLRQYTSFLALLPIAAIIFILYKTSIYLSHEQQVFKQASLNADEPA
jgi:hypothetical protein